MAYDPSVKLEAVRLRTEERLGLKDIAVRLDISQGTASAWLRAHPLPKETVEHRMSISGKASRGRRKVCKPASVPEVSSRFRDIVQNREYTTQQMGALAETAVLFRLYLHQFDVFRSAADGAKADWIVVDPESGRTAKVQVKSVLGGKWGLPSVSLRCNAGRGGSRRYRRDEFDFIVGYDLGTDICYVWSHEETANHRAVIAIREDAAERWDKFRDVAQPG